MEEEEKQPSFWDLNNPFVRDKSVLNCGFCRTGRGGSFGGGNHTRCGYNYGCIITGVIIVYLIYKQIKK